MLDSPIKSATKSILWFIIYIFRGSNLLNVALVHHDDSIRHGKGLFLIVCHIDKRDSRLLLDAFEFILHILAQPQIQCAQRFVEQQYFRLIDQRAGDGHTLLLAAGQGVGFAMFKAP